MNITPVLVSSDSHGVVSLEEKRVKVKVHYVNQTEPQSKHYILLLEWEEAAEEERALLGRRTARWGEQDKRIKGQRVNNVEIHNILEPYVIKKS